MTDIQKWEYKCEGCCTGKYFDSFIGILDQLGREGWELVHVTERKELLGDEVHLKGYFKRPVYNPVHSPE